MTRRSSSPSESEALLFGRRPVVELLRARRPCDRVLIASGMAASPVITEIRKRAQEAAIPIKVVPRAEIDKLVPDENHQGVVAVGGRFRYSALESLFTDKARLVFLDGVTDPHNLGSLIRSAECCGFDGLVVPTHRSVGVTPSVRRVAVGAAETFPIARVTNLGRALDQAKQNGIWVVGLDGDADDDIWTSELLEPPVALVLGAEGRGLSKVIRERCDGAVRIPQRGRVSSLNVAVAGAIAMFEVARREGSSATLRPEPATSRQDRRRSGRI